MNTENETGVKVPKGQINYNTVAGSLGLAAFAGLGLRNWLDNGNGSVAAGATAVAETQLVSGLMAELAKEKSERYADNVGINTFKKVVNSYLDAAISKATAKGSVNLFGFEFEATAFQNLKREIDNSLKNNVSHDERPA